MPALARGRRIRHHVNPLKLEFLSTEPARVPLPAGAEVEVELGCADALFLFTRARRLPAVQCVGVEIRRPMVAQVNERARAEGLGNLRAVFANMNADLGRLFEPGQVARFFLNFPDPWFKKAQQKRRVVTPEFVETMARLLRPGGEIFFQSDIWDLAIAAMEVFERDPSLRNVRGEWSFMKENPYGAESLREVRVQEKGLPVWRMIYRT